MKRPRIEWREITPCPSVHPEDGTECEREDGHSEWHWYTVWENGYPSYPVMWSEDGPESGLWGPHNPIRIEEEGSHEDP